MMQLAQQSIQDYLLALASAAPTPGGGAAVGVTAAQAAALLEMAVQVTGPGVWGGAGIELTSDLSRARVRFIELGEDDARAFDAVMTGLRLPKTDPMRASTLEHALKSASRVPLSLMRELALLYPLACMILERCKRHIVSDVGAAIRFADAALAASSYTVRINLDSIKDHQFVATTRRELRELLERTHTDSADLLRKVDTTLGG